LILFFFFIGFLFVKLEFCFVASICSNLWFCSSVRHDFISNFFYKSKTNFNSKFALNFKFNFDSMLLWMLFQLFAVYCLINTQHYLTSNFDSNRLPTSNPTIIIQLTSMSTIYLSSAITVSQSTWIPAIMLVAFIVEFLIVFEILS
jgi:hypothetical protein